MSNKMHIKGRSIYLRAITLTDITQEYLDWLNDEEITKYLEVRHSVQTKSSLTTFVEEKINSTNDFLFTICDNKTNKHIGNIKLGPIHTYYQKADISIFIGDKRFWGQGLATQAIELIIKYAFENLSLKKLLATFYKENIASIKAFEKAGFIIEGISEDYLTLNDNPHDLIWMGITKKQYKKGNLKE